MFGWFDRSSTSALSSSCVKDCTAVAPATMEALEGRLVFSTATGGEAAAAPDVVTQAEVAPVDLGGNLQFQSEGTRDHAYADLVKASSGFKNLSGGAATKDVNGWATQDFTVPLWKNSQIDPGRYTISFAGPSNAVVSLHKGAGVLRKVGTTSTGINNWTLDVPANSGKWELDLKLTNTGGRVKDLKVMQPGTTAGQVWNPKYVNHLKTLKPHTLRFMEIAKINNNTTATWAERPKLTDATWARAGAPWEHLISLANTVGSHAWICVPGHANDDYVRQLATLLKSQLNPNLRIYIEYSNETWNSLFEQGRYNLAQAEAEVRANPNSNLNYDGANDKYKWADRRNARRLKQITDVFKSVWQSAGEASPINGRVRAVLGGQVTRSEKYDDMLNFINANYGAPRNFFYGIGGAWYFQLNKWSDERMGSSGNITKEQVLEGMALSISAYENEQRFARPAARAAGWGLKLAAYELGVDTMGRLNVQAKAEASRDIRMKGLMERFVRAWDNQGGEEAVWYTVGARSYISNSGTWTVTENLANTTSAKMQAFRALRGVTGTDPTPTPTPTPEPTPTPTPTTPVTLRAAADAYVRDGTFAGTNYGAAGQLQVKQSGTSYNRESYLRLDLSSVSTINSAKLRLFGRLDNTSSASVGFRIFNSSNTTWSESGVTWNSKLTSGTTVRGSGTVSGVTGKWYEVDLTTFLKGEKAAGRNVVTLVIKAAASSGATIIFESDEATANRPELLVG